MANDGKELEHLVSFVEETLVPKGFKVTINRRIVDGDGNQLAEFDIEVSGKVGTGDINWLIECRDRPSQGPAPGSWIEQLVGRRDRFKLNRVTAVSTTGFSSSARKYAEESGIDLREVKSIDPKEFAWLALEYLDFHERVHDLKNVKVNVVMDTISPEALADLKVILKESTNQTPLLVNSAGERATIMDVFFRLTKDSDLWEKITVEGNRLRLRALAQFKEEDRFAIHTDHGDIPVGSIEFEGELFIRTTKIAPETFKYKDTTTGEVISEVAKFAVDHPQLPHSIEFHRISGSETMPVILRVTKKDGD